jgi:hypothetical protein
VRPAEPSLKGTLEKHIISVELPAKVSGIIAWLAKMMQLKSN